MAAPGYDAVLIVGFGGPEGPDDVMPFLRNVVRGRDVPDHRLVEVAEQYHRFGGVSPINRQTRALAEALDGALRDRGIDVPVVVGNRNWHPMLADTVATLDAAGSQRVLAVATSAFSSYSGCRQYLDDLDAARVRAEVSDRMRIDKLPPLWELPGFLDAVTDRVADAMAEAAAGPNREPSRLVFTAHSLPVAAAATCEYVAQLREASAVVAAHFGVPHDLVFQSRSGPPSVPWLEPDVVDHLAALAPGEGVVVVPIGFVSDHMEVVFDLDTQAAQAAHRRGVSMVRAGTVGTHPAFVGGLADAVAARFDGEVPATFDGRARRPFPCRTDCCPPPRRPAR